LADRWRGARRLVGINGGLRHHNEFINNRGKTIPKGSLTLFVLVKRSTLDKVLPEIEPFRSRALKTSLSKKQEDRLRAAFANIAVAA
jgi:uncharacterized membrane protein